MQELPGRWIACMPSPLHNALYLRVFPCLPIQKQVGECYLVAAVPVDPFPEVSKYQNIKVFFGVGWNVLVNQVPLLSLLFGFALIGEAACGCPCHFVNHCFSFLPDSGATSICFLLQHNQKTCNYCLVIAMESLPYSYMLIIYSMIFFSLQRNFL